jgi:hypothetical protein
MCYIVTDYEKERDSACDRRYIGISSRKTRRFLSEVTRYLGVNSRRCCLYRNPFKENVISPVEVHFYVKTLLFLLFSFFFFNRILLINTTLSFTKIKTLVMRDINTKFGQLSFKKAAEG